MAKVELWEGHRITPYAAGKTWSFSIKLILGAKLHNQIAILSYEVAKFRCQTEVTEIEFPCV